MWWLQCASHKVVTELVNLDHGSFVHTYIISKVFSIQKAMTSSNPRYNCTFLLDATEGFFDGCNYFGESQYLDETMKTNISLVLLQFFVAIVELSPMFPFIDGPSGRDLALGILDTPLAPIAGKIVAGQIR